jgi:hypothetical protein
MDLETNVSTIRYEKDIGKGWNVYAAASNAANSDPDGPKTTTEIGVGWTKKF